MSKSAWRFFPAAIAAFLVVVACVDGGMIWSAVASFPGAADGHPFETGNRYNAVLAAAARQAELGWQLKVGLVNQDVEVTLSGKNGEMLPAGEIQAIATHPVGPESPTKLSFSRQGTSYVSTSALPAAGQWDLEVSAKIDGVQYRTTRRIIVQ